MASLMCGMDACWLGGRVRASERARETKKGQRQRQRARAPWVLWSGACISPLRERAHDEGARALGEALQAGVRGPRAHEVVFVDVL